MSDELLKRLETGHDKECAMSYGMHEHCCDCSYPTRQEAAARVRELEDDNLRLAISWQREHDRAERAEAKYEDEIQMWRNACELMNRAEADNERLRAKLASAMVRLQAVSEDIDAALADGTKEPPC